jgi:hypothetical protein
MVSALRASDRRNEKVLKQAQYEESKKRAWIAPLVLKQRPELASFQATDALVHREQ